METAAVFLVRTIVVDSSLPLLGAVQPFGLDEVVLSELAALVLQVYRPVFDRTAERHVGVGYVGESARFTLAVLYDEPLLAQLEAREKRVPEGPDAVQLAFRAVAVRLGKARVKYGVETNRGGVTGRDVEPVVHRGRHGPRCVDHHAHSGTVQNVVVHIVDAPDGMHRRELLDGDDEGQAVLRARGVHLELRLQLPAVKSEAAEVVAVEEVGEVLGAAVLAVEAAVDEHVLQAVAHVPGHLAQVLVEGARAPEEARPAEGVGRDELDPLVELGVLVRQRVDVVERDGLYVADGHGRELHGHAVLDLTQLHHLELQVLPHEQRQLERGRREADDDQQSPDDLALRVTGRDDLGEAVRVALGAELGNDLYGAPPALLVSVGGEPVVEVVVVQVVVVVVVRAVSHGAVVVVVVVVVVPVLDHFVVAGLAHLRRDVVRLGVGRVATTHSARDACVFHMLSTGRPREQEKKEGGGGAGVFIRGVK